MSGTGNLRDELGAGGAPRLSSWHTPGRPADVVGSATRPAARPAAGGLAGVAAAGRDRSDRLDTEVRVFLLILAIGDTLAALFHGVVLDVVSSGDEWWRRWSLAALSWPHPLAQPITASVVAAVVAALAVASLGFTRTRPWQCGVLAGAAIAGVLAMIPLILFLVGWAIAIVVFIVVFVVILGLVGLVLAS